MIWLEGQKIWLVEEDHYELHEGRIIKNDHDVYGAEYTVRGNRQINSMDYLENRSPYTIYADYGVAYRTLRKDILIKLRYYTEKLELLEGGVE